MALVFKKQTVAYNEIKDSLQTGDIILMKGLYSSSHVIELIEHSDWSHAAIVVLAKDINFDSDDPILLWESNIKQEKKEYQNEKVIDLLTKGKKDDKNGPQLVSLRQRMQLNYKHKDDGKFAVRHLYTERNQQMFDTLKEVMENYHSATFPTTKEEIEDPIKGRFHGIQTSEKHIFCSELVAITFIKMGLLSTVHTTNSYIPADFSDAMSVGLLKRAWLGNEIMIDPLSL